MKIAFCLYGDNENLDFWKQCQRLGQELYDIEVDIFLTTNKETSPQKYLKKINSVEINDYLYMIEKCHLSRNEYEVNNNVTYDYVIQTKSNTPIKLESFLKTFVKMNNLRYSFPSVYSTSDNDIKDNSLYGGESNEVYFGEPQVMDVFGKIYSFIRLSNNCDYVVKEKEVFNLMMKYCNLQHRQKSIELI
tara:strand:+ start:223 stop:792 length:570 start_codon:yes stop_codon:yes gene_type:complete